MEGEIMQKRFGYLREKKRKTKSEMVIDENPEKLQFMKSLYESTSTCWTMIMQNNL